MAGVVVVIIIAHITIMSQLDTQETHTRSSIKHRSTCNLCHLSNLREAVAETTSSVKATTIQVATITMEAVGTSNRPIIIREGAEGGTVTTATTTTRIITTTTITKAVTIADMCSIKRTALVRTTPF